MNLEKLTEMLGNEIFKGYYKGPVDGTYKMQRVR